MSPTRWWNEPLFLGVPTRGLPSVAFLTARNVPVARFLNLYVPLGGKDILLLVDE
jgi:hypothetical protein